MRPTNYSIIINYLDAPENASYKEQLDRWLSEDERNKVLFAELKQLWETSAAAAAFEGIDTDAATLRFRELLAGHFQPSAPPVIALLRKRARWKWPAAAAAILAVAGVSYWLTRPPVENYITFTTRQQIDSVLLADGSRVILNAHSTFRYPAAFQGSARQVFLDSGTAFFDIRPDAAHPFTASTGELDIDVLGTAFNLSSAGDEVKLFVLSGEVAFGMAKTGSPLRLKAGAGASFHKGTGQLAQDTQVDYNQLAWKTMELHFRDTPMEDVCKVLTTHYQIKIILENDARKAQKLNANFSHNSIEEVLETLNALYDYRFEKRGDTIFIR